MITPVDKIDDRIVENFVSVSNAPGAGNASFCIKNYIRSPDHVLRLVILFLHKSTFPTGVEIRILLQLAFPRFIANGAVQWMVNQEEFHHRVLGFDDLWYLEQHVQSFTDRVPTRWLEFGHILDDRVAILICFKGTIGLAPRHSHFNQANAAVCWRRHCRMPAKMGNLDAVF